MSEDTDAANHWSDDIRRHFPDWQTDASLERWPEVRRSFQIGQPVSGCVIAHSPFGVWLNVDDIWPALILVSNLNVNFDLNGYPAIGKLVDAQIESLGASGELGLTQLPQS